MSTALITGASAGLGMEFARLFAQDGHDLILVARRRDRLEALAKELSGVQVRILAMDLGQPGAGARIFENLRGSHVDFLVNNAGFGSNGEFAGLDLANELKMIDLNVRTLTELCHLYLPDMKKRGFGRILNVGSVAGFQPGPYMATYYASKAYVNSFSLALSEELRGTGVTCTVLAPGATVTEFAQAAHLENSRLFRSAAANAAEVARDGYRAMHEGRAMVISGFRNQALVEMQRLAPRSLIRKVAARLNRP